MRKVNKDNQNKGPAVHAGNVRRQNISGNTIAAGIDAIVIFISLAFPWYAIRLHDYDSNIAWDMSISYLVTDTTSWWSLWIGSALPVIGIIVLASTVLLLAIYSMLKGTEATYADNPFFAT